VADLTPKEVLVKARTLIATPSNWTRSELERLDGSVCAIGAINLALGIDNQDMQVQETYLTSKNKSALELLASVLPTPRGWRNRPLQPELIVFSYNDKNPHACVLAAFDAAIEKAGADD